MNHISDETICAISTAAGVGGIAVIRVSGSHAIAISDKIFKPLKSGKSIAEMDGNTIQFGHIVNNKNEIIDEVLISLFRNPHSFTGEDVVEIGCHGSLFIQQEILKLLIENGCSMAKAGEFTQRAFLNGKMDLSQAEAVADLIASNSKAAHRIALNQMRGGFSEELTRLRMKLLDFTSLVELELDFADHEELEFADRSELQSLANEIEQKINQLTNSFSVGNAIKNGVPVAIVGETNAGKSTLLKEIWNVLKERKDIVASYMPQDYRDIIDYSLTPTEFLQSSYDKEKYTLALTHMGTMKFTRDEMKHTIGELSGGQRAKIIFLNMVLQKANVLILDEPTRNFSPLSAPVIRQALMDFQGTIISISHDRKYLDEVADLVYVLSEDGLKLLQ